MEFSWSTDQLYQVFSTPGTLEITVTATNALNTHKWLTITFVVQDEKVAGISLGLVSEIKVEDDDNVYLAVGEVVQFIITITNGTGVSAELDYSNSETITVLKHHNNRNQISTIPITYIYTEPYTMILPSLCTTNTAGTTCATLDKNLTLITPLSKPNILLNAHIKRGTVITASTDLVGDGVQVRSEARWS